jgi:hypothetical protein
MTRYKVTLEVHVDADLTELQMVGLGTHFNGADADDAFRLSADPNLIFFTLLTPAIHSALESALDDPDVSIPAFQTGVVS